MLFEGLPNYTYKPCMSTTGNFFFNGVECISGVPAFQDVAKTPEM